MRFHVSTGLVVAALCITTPAAGAAAAGGTTPDALDADIQAEIDALRAEIQEFNQDRELEPTDAERRAEIRAIVQDVLADAEDRISFQDDAVIPGWKKGFQFRSPDGNFLLKVGGQLQVRYVLNHAERTR